MWLRRSIVLFVGGAAFTTLFLWFVGSTLPIPWKLSILTLIGFAAAGADWVRSQDRFTESFDNTARERERLFLH